MSEGRGVDGRSIGRAVYRALVLDDDEETLAFAAAALHAFAPGFEVATARDLREAAAWLETFQPDLLLVEMKFSREAAAALAVGGRSGASPRDCPIVIVSRLVGEDILADPARANAAAALRKPFGLQTLLGTVRRVVRQPTDH
jgi:DNA-binding response OmpR family regulator